MRVEKTFNSVLSRIIRLGYIQRAKILSQLHIFQIDIYRFLQY